MDITTKSAIGLALAGVTATGGYFGWKALSSSGELAQKDWENQNKSWFGTKFKAFKDKANASTTNSDLSKQWATLQTEFSGTNSLTEYEIARKLQDWCKGTNVDTKFEKVRAECGSLA